jgi:hypothetical protein
MNAFDPYDYCKSKKAKFKGSVTVYTKLRVLIWKVVNRPAAGLFGCGSD